MSIREYRDKQGRTKYRVAVDIGATTAGKRAVPMTDFAYRKLIFQYCF